MSKLRSALKKTTQLALAIVGFALREVVYLVVPMRLESRFAPIVDPRTVVVPSELEREVAGTVLFGLLLKGADTTTTDIAAQVVHPIAVYGAAALGAHSVARPPQPPGDDTQPARSR